METVKRPDKAEGESVGAAGSAKVAIVILNWNGAADTIACIESLAHLDDDDFGILVCDNASSDNSVSRLRAWGQEGLRQLNARLAGEGRRPFDFADHAGAALPVPEQGAPPLAGLRRIALIQTGANGGYAAGNNAGLRHALAAGFEHFWILNNDTEVEPDALFWLRERMAGDARIGICGSTLVYFSRRDLVQSWGGSHFLRLKGRGVTLGPGVSRSAPIDQAAVEAALSYVNGASMFVSRSFLEHIGLMQEDYFLYWEEMDWAARASGQFKLGYASRSVVYHKVGASIGTNDFGDRSALSDYYMARSRLKFCWRFSRISVPFVIFDIARRGWRWARRGEWRRAALLLRAIVGLPFAKPPG